MQCRGVLVGWALWTVMWFVYCTKGASGTWKPARASLGPASCARAHTAPFARLNKGIVQSRDPLSHDAEHAIVSHCVLHLGLWVLCALLDGEQMSTYLAESWQWSLWFEELAFQLDLFSPSLVGEVNFWSSVNLKHIVHNCL